MATVSFLFVDQVNSTDQLRALGDSQTVVVRDRLQTILRSAVDVNGGTVVDHTGDGVLATFPGAAEALAAGVAMQREAERQSRRQGELAFRLRVGVHTGEPAANAEGRPVGMAVVIAARLCVDAAPGEILTSDLVRLLVGDRFTMIDGGTRHLKGVGDAVRSFAVVWTAEGAPALPPGLVPPGEVAFVGREAEMRILATAWAEAKAGSGRTVLLSGEPGIGKSRLAAETASLAAQEGGLVLFGRCDEHLAVPFLPFVQALRGFLEQLPTRDVTGLLGPHAIELSRLVPRIADLAEGEILRSDPNTERLQLFEAVAGWLDAAARLQPVVIVIDDLQWATAPTVLMFRHLVRSVHRGVLALATYRDTDLDRTHSLAAALPELRRAEGVTRLAVGGLSPQAVGDLLTGDDGQFGTVLHQETGGNAFFVGEVLRHLADQQAVKRDGDRWAVRGDVVAVPLPEGVRDVVGQRLSRLSDQANQALTVAAVVGDDFLVDAVVEASGLDGDIVAEALDEASVAHIVVAESGRPLRYRFAHALVRECLYREVGPARRLRLHTRMATAIERLTPADVDSLAHHWLSASPEYVAKAVAYAETAGDQALGALAHEVAVAHYYRALDALDAHEPEHQRLRLPLLLRLGNVHGRLGNLDQGAECLSSAADLARALNDQRALADAAILAAGYYPGAATMPESLPLVEEALRALPDDDSARRARLLCIQATRLDDPAARLAIGRQGLEMAERVGDAIALAYACASFNYVLGVGGPAHVEEALEFAPRVRAAATTSGDLDLIGASALNFIIPANVLGRVGVIRDQIEWLKDFGERHRSSYYGAAAELLRGMLALAEGQLHDVDEAVAAAMQWGPTDPNIYATVGVLTFFAARTKGTLAELEPSLEAMRADPATIERYGPMVDAFRVLLRAELSRPGASSELRELTASLPLDGLDSGIVGLLAESAIILRDTETAGRVVPILASWSGMLSVVQPAAWIAPADLLAGELAVLANDRGLACHHLGVAEQVLDQIDLDLAPFRARLLATRGQLHDG